MPTDPQIVALASFSATTQALKELGEVVGKIVIKKAGGGSWAAKLGPLSAPLARLVGKLTKADPKTQLQDARKVLKLSDAADIVRKNVNALQEAAELSKWIVPFPISPRPEDSSTLAERIIQQMRAKVLSQQNPRVSVLKRVATRKP